MGADSDSGGIARYYDPDVARRENEDGGFSRGWGFHVLPSERYWIDTHCHFRPALTVST